MHSTAQSCRMRLTVIGMSAATCSTLEADNVIMVTAVGLWFHVYSAYLLQILVRKMRATHAVVWSNWSDRNSP